MGDVHLDLVLSFDARTIDGQLRQDDGSTRRFHGWLGLVDALERLRPGAEAGTSPDAATTREAP